MSQDIPGLPEYVKKEIIRYTNYLYNSYIDKVQLVEYDIPAAYFLELTYKNCVDNYLENNSLELFESQITAILDNLRESEEVFKQFQKREVELVGLDEYGLLHFNHNPEIKIIYNEETRTWEFENQQNNNIKENNNE